MSLFILNIEITNFKLKNIGRFIFDFTLINPFNITSYILNLRSIENY